MAAYKILVDAMGGDYAPKAPVEGALIALERHSDLSIVIAGREPEIRKALEGKSYDAGSRIGGSDAHSRPDPRSIASGAFRGAARAQGPGASARCRRQRGQ